MEDYIFIGLAVLVLIGLITNIISRGYKRKKLQITSFSEVINMLSMGDVISIPSPYTERFSSTIEMINIKDNPNKRGKVVGYVTQDHLFKLFSEPYRNLFIIDYRTIILKKDKYLETIVKYKILEPLSK